MTFGVLLFPGVEELDFAGPWEVAAMWSAYAGGPRELVTVAQVKGALRCAKGLGVVADHDFEDCPPLEYLVVPGGHAVFNERENDALIDFVRTRGRLARHVLSVCSGAFLLHEAGLLEGKSATTHWKALDQLAGLAGVTVRQERWVRDGAVWTSAGVSAGIDMTLALIAAVAGAETAGIVQRHAEYYPEARIYGSAHSGNGAAEYFRNLQTTDPA